MLKLIIKSINVNNILCDEQVIQDQFQSDMGQEKWLNVDTFYNQLQHAKGPVLDRFLAQAGLPDEVLFDKFLTNFISSRYLLSYLKMENITIKSFVLCLSK